MKYVFRQYGSVAALLALILALAVTLTLFTGGLTWQEDSSVVSVLATTYPLYVAAQNVIGEDGGIALSRLDGAASGCLHDYQLSPSDRRGVGEAQLILMNGAGAESFLHGIIDEDKCVDTSAGLFLLEGECRDHEEEGHHHAASFNEHLWLSPTHYAAQVAAVRDALIRVRPEMAAQYAANAAVYIENIAAVGEALPHFEGRPCVLFHDSLSYLAAEVGLDVRLTLSVEGESGLSAHDLAAVEALAAEHPDLLLLYDSQYALRYEGVGGIPVTLHTAVVGNGSIHDWLTAMYKNVDVLNKTLEKTVKREGTP